MSMQYSRSNFDEHETAVSIITVPNPGVADLSAAVGVTLTKADGFAGCVVASLEAGGLFAQAGVKLGDRLLTICGDEVGDPACAAALLEEVGSVGCGSFEIEVQRGGEADS
jgi:C-terminal processing protease CtpA/Prc